jgi:hypothetical protein
MTTSALHHLPDLASLRQTFQRLESLLPEDGGLYVFDFGLLRSPHTRKLMVAEVAKLAPPITAKDYELSLQAAFPVSEVLRMAREELLRPVVARLSSFVDFFYFLQTAPRAKAPETIETYIAGIWAGLSAAMKMEYLMLRTMRRKR